MPTFPIFLNPKAIIGDNKLSEPKYSQKVALYPSINISVAVSALSRFESVTLEETTAVIASSTELPILEIVLNTPLAKL